jgi:hypothetical protein
MTNPTRPRMTHARSRAPRGLLSLLWIPLTCLAFTWVGMRASGAYFAARDMRLANDAIEIRYLTLQQQNQRIEREVKAFQTPAGIVRAARRLGWVKQGEVHLRVP